jgi:hypothetical protein
MKLARFSTLLLCGSVLLHSCVKMNYDNPPDTTQVDPKLTETGSLSDLSNMGLGLLAGTARVLGDTTVSGIVVGDDRSGNIYKKLFIQDATGGIELVLDKTYLYTDYPVGRKVYVKLKGLYLMNYKGTPEVVFSMNADGTTNGIPSSLLGAFIVKANYPNTITPPELTMFDIVSNPAKYVNTLVTLTQMQFASGSNNVPFSAPYSSTNRTLVNCGNTSTITMYNSNYANFQSAITPNGNGKITGLITLYNSTPQFTLRDTTDIHFTDTRCP